MPPGFGTPIPNVVGMSMAGSTPLPSIGNPQAQGFFSGGGFNDFASGLRGVTRNFAAGFAKDPAVRQQAGNALMMDEQNKQAEKREMIAQSFERMKTLAAAIQGTGSVPPALGGMIDKEAAILGQLSGDPAVGQQMKDYAFALAQTPREQDELTARVNSLREMGYSEEEIKQQIGARVEPEKPMTELGQIEADLAAGRITPEQAAAAQRKATHFGPSTVVNIDNKPITEGQAQSIGFAGRAGAANDIVVGLEREGYRPSGVEETLGGISGIGNYLISDTTRQYNSAKGEFIAAVLRKESQASITDEEYVREDKNYFPQPGDDEKTIADKAARRQRKIEDLKREGRPITAGEAKDETTEQTLVGDGTQQAPVVVKSPEEAAKLAPGTWFKTPDGRVLQRQ